MGQTVNLSQLTDFAKFSTEFSNLGADYIFTRITSTDSMLKLSNGPFRIDGMTWLLCYSGHLDVEVNLRSRAIGPKSLIVTSPHSIVEVKSIDWENLDCYLLFVSGTFMRDINFDVNILSSATIRNRHDDASPVIKITDDDFSLLRNYFELVHHNTIVNPDDMYVRSISRCVIAALCYQMMQMAVKYAKLSHEYTDEHSRSKSRRIGYVQDFMTLVHTHHNRERSVSFYADKLFISPKYLSLIIKEATGRTAADWIDEFVILEAKNLLRFSGKNIQQIAYELNFPNQSSFGKYFKHLTGMSPSQYQRS